MLNFNAFDAPSRTPSAYRMPAAERQPLRGVIVPRMFTTPCRACPAAVQHIGEIGVSMCDRCLDELAGDVEVDVHRPLPHPHGVVHQQPAQARLPLPRRDAISSDIDDRHVIGYRLPIRTSSRHGLLFTI